MNAATEAGREQYVSFTPQTSYSASVSADGCCHASLLSTDGFIKITAKADNETSDVISGYVKVTITDPYTGASETWSINVYQRYQN
jgi:hypothetical protein